MNDNYNGSQQNLIRRLNLIEGQICGIKKMIAEKRLCDDIINQLESTRAALKSLQVVILHNHINTIVIHENSNHEFKSLIVLIKKMLK